MKSFANSLFLAALVAACSTTSSPPVEDTAQGSPHAFTLKYKDHPLAGKIWDAKRQEFVENDTLLEQALTSQYLLLGETHDNTYHHEKQAWIIDQLHKHIGSGNAGVAFEMIDDKQYEKFKDTSITSSQQLISLLNTEQVGWEYEKYYLPVFNSAISAGFPVYPANINRESLMSIIRQGKKNIPQDLKQRIEKQTLSEAQINAMKQEIVKSHCGMANEKMVDAMLLGQSVRDATMSQNLVNHTSDSAVMVLVTGSGHARKDRGVPHYLQQDTKGKKIISIAWLEVSPQIQEVSDYTKYWGGDTLPFDFVWFTPMADRPDPCEQMRKHMEKHQRKQQEQEHEPARKTPRTRMI